MDEHHSLEVNPWDVDMDDEDDDEEYSPDSNSPNDSDFVPDEMEDSDEDEYEIEPLTGGDSDVNYANSLLHCEYRPDAFRNNQNLNVLI
jgi:hypothetical protein